MPEILNTKIFYLVGIKNKKPLDFKVTLIYNKGDLNKEVCFGKGKTRSSN